MRWILGWANSPTVFWTCVVTGWVSLPSLIHCYHSGELSSTIPTSTSSAADRKDLDGFSYSQALSFSSPVHTHNQEQLSSFAWQGVRPTLQFAAVGNKESQLFRSHASEASSPTCSWWQEVGGACFPHVCPHMSYNAGSRGCYPAKCLKTDLWLIAMNIFKMYELKRVLCDSQWHITASTLRLCCCFFLFLFVCLYVLKCWFCF